MFWLYLKGISSLKINNKTNFQNLIFLF